MANKVKSSEVNKLAQIPLIPNNLDWMSKTTGRKIKLRQAQTQLEYLGDSMA